MHSIFRCDCGAHLLEIGYDKSTKDCNFEDLSICIYDVYNPDTGRKYRKPKLLADVCLLNNLFPNEIDLFFDFILKVIKNRVQAKSPLQKQDTKEGALEKNINKSMTTLREMYKKLQEENKEILKRKK